MATAVVLAGIAVVCSSLSSAPAWAEGADVVHLRGAGATFPNELYSVWMTGYKVLRQRYTVINMTYQAIGSGAGKSLITSPNPDVDYIGTDSPLTDADLEKHTDLRMFPTAAGAVALAFHLPGVTSLNLSRHLLVGIYNGTITRWNDLDIATLNPDSQLPNETIRVIARADKSGTTQIFTAALTSFSDAWAATYGTFSDGLDAEYRPVRWRPAVAHFYAHGNGGMSGLIRSVRYTIGYLSIGDVRKGGISYAGIVNWAGRLTFPTAASIQSAMEDHLGAFKQHLAGDLVDGDGEFSYPIAGYTYLVARVEGMETCRAAEELYGYVEWFLTADGPRRDCEALFFSPLSAAVVEKVRAHFLQNFSCDGIPVASSLRLRREWEQQQEESWRIPLYATLPVLFILAFALLAALAVQQVRINGAIWRKEYLIPAADLIPMKGLNCRFGTQSWSGTGSVAIAATSDRVSTEAGGSSLGTTTIGTLEPVLLYRLKGPDDALVTLAFSNIQSQLGLKLRTKRLMLWMRDNINHANVARFIGLTTLQGTTRLVCEHYPKGNLRDILSSNKYNLDDNFKFSMSEDIAAGLAYLHRQGVVHGNLQSACCYIDAKWNVHVGDWQYGLLADHQRGHPVNPDLEEAQDPQIIARRLYWTAPEHLWDSTQRKTCESDVYSFGVILCEVFTREEPYQHEAMAKEPVAVIQEVKASALRPCLPEGTSASLKALITAAWAGDPRGRPTFRALRKSLARMKPSKLSVLDCMMEATEGYVRLLEDKVEERTLELRETMIQMKALLHKMLPPSVADKLSRGQPVPAELYDSVTIFFSDIVGFTQISAESSPMEVVTMLNDLYTVFDAIMDKHDVYKVETIGDAYMVISGLPERNGTAHASHIASMAVEIVAMSSRFVIRHRPNYQLTMRVGIHSGPVCAGVVGIKMPRFCLFGDTVNTASRMESTSVPMKIQISETTQQLLQQEGGFLLQERGEVLLKGKGVVKTYWLHGKLDSSKPMPSDFRRTIEEM